ncbi:MAG: YdcF family protein [Nocardioides sp.]
MGRRADATADLEVIGRYLARRDLASLDPADVRRSFDVLVLCGSGVPATVELAARAFHEGIAPTVLVTGGVGHSTPYLADAVSAHPVWHDVPTAGRPEAAVIVEILHRHLGVPPAAVVTEEQATNCGENAELSLRILAAGPGVGSVLLVQDPTMQRRTHASLDHHQHVLGTAFEVVSQAPFVPVVRPDGVGDMTGAPAWTLDRFVALAIGEVRRLRDDEHGYGPRGAGFLDHVDVPDDVVAAAERVAQAFPNLRSRRA